MAINVGKIGTVSSGNLRERLEEQQARIKVATAEESEAHGIVDSSRVGVNDLLTAIKKALDLAHPLRHGLKGAVDTHSTATATIRSAAGDVADLVDDTNRRDVGATADILSAIGDAAKVHKGDLAEIDDTLKAVVDGLEDLEKMLDQRYVDLLASTATGMSASVERLEGVDQQMDTYVPFL